MCCRALTDSVVIRLPVQAFEEVFRKNPEMLIRVVQVREEAGKCALIPAFVFDLSIIFYETASR